MTGLPVQLKLEKHQKLANLEPVLCNWLSAHIVSVGFVEGHLTFLAQETQEELV